jgi:hypothetical protein
MSDAFDRVFTLTDSRNIDLRKESLFVLINAVTGSDLKLRATIYDKTRADIFQRLLKALNFQDPRLQFSTLDGIEELFKLDDWLGTVNTE